jgi:hypothetical protein
MTIILERAPQLWVCPNCPTTAQTVGEPNRFHNCAGLAGLFAPMVPTGTDARVTANVREDYVSREDVQYDGEGRPIMSVTTERADGSSDTVAFAPTAYVWSDH